MTQTQTVREQLYLAIHGSEEFHAKAASATGELQPDPAGGGHREIAEHLKSLGELFAKTAQYVQRGFPARTVLEFLAKEAQLDAPYQEKLASLIDETGELALQNHIFSTYQKKVQAKKTVATKTAQQQKTPSARITGAVDRFKHLQQFVGQ